MSWSHSKVYLQSSLLGVALMAWGRKEMSCTDYEHMMLLNLSSFLSVASFAVCALTQVSVLVEALRRFGFSTEHTLQYITGRRSIQRWFTVQYAATLCRSSCSYVQYRSVVERDRKLSPEPRFWMLMITAAKLHIVCLERNLGAKMYYLSVKVSILKIADAAYF